jgi:Zn-dependent protease with chaperone function
MNFFERQAAARSQSKRLLLLFGLAVLCIVFAVAVVLYVCFVGLNPDSEMSFLSVLVLSALLNSIVIGGASLYRITSLRVGGEKIAQEMGGIPVAEDTTDFQLRRLRNVVEEIAIASGVPVPRIYVLPDEEAINAFAAGYSPSDAAVAVTHGALKRLNRDELQGVIAHEFSHILNGDMRLNIRLIGVLFGILALGIIGRKILTHGRSSSKDGAPVLIFALGILAIGYIGMFFGRMIKAGVSRQREYLADASAVQFTRQSKGLAGALKKVAGLPEGSQFTGNNAEEVSHMLFGDGCGLSGMMATHPPLFDRIKALEPSFRKESFVDQVQRWVNQPPLGLDEDRALGLTARGEFAMPASNAQIVVTPPAVVAQVGAPHEDDFRRASAITHSLPDELLVATRSMNAVVPLLFGLMHSRDDKVRERQQFELKSRRGDAMASVSLHFYQQCQALHPMHRLPLASLCFPLLRKRPRKELEEFIDALYVLAHADGRIDIFEYCLSRLLQVQVLDVLNPHNAMVVGKRSLRDAQNQAISLMAFLARVGHDTQDAAKRAFLAGSDRLFPRLNVAYTAEVPDPRKLDDVWPVLDALDPPSKSLLIEGLVVAVSHDGAVSVNEAELLRVICASLHCPLPPMLEHVSRVS